MFRVELYIPGLCVVRAAECFEFGLAVHAEILACLALQLCFSSSIGMVLRLLSLVIASVMMEIEVKLDY